MVRVSAETEVTGDWDVHGQNERLAQHEADPNPGQILLVAECLNDCRLYGCDLGEGPSEDM